MQHVTIREYSARENGSFRADEIGLLEDSFNLMIVRNQELIAQKFQTRIEKRSAQLRALQAQINPHFLYNTLQSIGGMALKKDAPEIYGVTVDLSDILRYSLSFSREMVPLEEEIKYLDSYLAIQNQRFGSRIKTARNIDPEWLKVLIPKLILQPIVENSLEHGLAEKPGSWEITISAAAAGENDMLLVIADNGLGMALDRLQYIREELAKGEENAIASSAHIGLNNVNSRIRLKYGVAYGVTVESGPGQGTKVSILLRAVREGETWPAQLS
jgi:sensor histidine kinase YesM